MRRSRKAISRIRRPGESNVSLFPFLAVLICTMGALILLLVVIARQARVQAAQTALADDADRASRKKELQTAEDSVAWRMEQIRVARRKTEAQLAEARLELAHLEDHANRLAQDLVRLEATWKELDARGTDGGRQRTQLETELEQLKIQITQAEKQIAEAQENANRQRNSYAVVPYEGPNGTRRRPIYIECRADTVVLQPEGVVLREDDFAGPLGPGNPLEVALRAVSEYLMRQNADTAAGRPIEPYPLLLVRPDGIEAYYAARTAMKSWASDFGYELIDDGWDLQFGARDPVLVQEITQAVATARARQRFLMAAAPGRYGPGPHRPTYAARPHHGGLIRADGSGGEGYYGAAEDRSSGGFGRGFTAAGSPSPAASTGGRISPGDATLSSRAGGSRDSNAMPAADPAGAGSHRTDVSRGSEESDFASSRPRGRFGRLADPAESGPRGQVPHRDGTVAGRQPGEADRSSAVAGNPLRPGEWTPKPQRGRPQTSQTPPSGGAAPNLAKTRGHNWALPDSSGGSTPITRPIRVFCHRDRIALVSETGAGGGQTVALTTRTEETIDTFVSAVWDHMASWGIAGNGMYWRPVLNVRVAPDAESRFNDLELLLKGSGLEVRRRKD